MSENIQENRIFKIETTFGKDVLLLQSIKGRESISEPFEFEFSLHSEDHNLSFEEIIGTKAAVTIKLEDDSERHLNGVINSFRHEGTFVLDGGHNAAIFSHYRATLVPWFWTLQLNNDCRIFQTKTVPEIVAEIFGEHSSANYKNRLTKTYPEREYCVQYRESDFNFVSRLLEEEGIYYFFEHKNNEHTLVLIDDFSQIKSCPHQPEADFITLRGNDKTGTFIKHWNFSREMRPDSVELRDFNFKNPSLNLTVGISSKNGKKFEIYDFPGEYDKHADGDKLVKIRYEEQQCRTEKSEAVSNGRGFEAGFRFALNEHPRNDFNREYSILSVEHNGRQATYRSDTSDFFYESNLVCIPYRTQFRPKRKTPIPKIVGTQTAIVVGIKGEEIDPDKHGRVKVHFHWDRKEKNAKSSCWVRVSQPWAGTGFGGITIPRIGQEVIVDFLEGNPDCPIITGRVYNGESKPPYTLPDHKAHSGLMSRSTPNGGNSNFNGIRMNDNIGAEKMEVQAEKDQEILVKNNNDKTVGNNETAQIGVDRTENVGNNETITIGNNRTEDVGSNETVKIGNNRNMTVGDNEVLSVGLTRTHSVGINEAINIGVAQEISVGAVQIVSIGMTQMVNVGLKQKTTAGKEISLKAPKILLEATAELTIKCGAGIITFDAAGNITIKSPMVKINC
jgi:type VI secretion system secreted protein VgrG